MVNADVISMPDKWEYPWYAAWDLAFHAVAFAPVDLDFAKSQLELLLQRDVSAPERPDPGVRVELLRRQPAGTRLGHDLPHRISRRVEGHADIDFLKRSFGKLLANFTWWVNRKDRHGTQHLRRRLPRPRQHRRLRSSSPLPTGGYLEQADGTAWMALFAQNMLEIAVEIAAQDATFEGMAVKFVDHFLGIANALNRVGDTGMWDENDGFYYDVLRAPDGSSTRLKVRSLVGLLPLCATTVVEPWQRARVPKLMAHVEERMRRNPALADGIHATGRDARGYGDRGILAVVDQQRLRRILARDARRTGVPEPVWHPGAVAAARAIRTCCMPAAVNIASPTRRPNPTAACSAAIRTGAVRSGCR